MTWDEIQGNWKAVSDKIKLTWGKLSEEDLTSVAGRRDQLLRPAHTDRRVVLPVNDFEPRIPDACCVAVIFVKELAHVLPFRPNITGRGEEDAKMERRLLVHDSIISQKGAQPVELLSLNMVGRFYGDRTSAVHPFPETSSRPTAPA